MKTTVRLALALLCLTALLLVSCGSGAGEQTTEAPVGETTPPATEAVDQTPKKYVAITFDDGPHVSRTRLIVDKLKEYGATATFFVVGNRINNVTGEALQYAVENGCEISIHGYTHEYYYDTCSDAQYQKELDMTASAIRKYLGQEYAIPLMRPIGGRISEERRAACSYRIVLWDVDSDDWRYKAVTDEASTAANVNQIVENILSQVEEGSIVLMHEIYQNSYDAFCIVLDRLYEMGYTCVTVSELYALSGK